MIVIMFLILSIIDSIFLENKNSYFIFVWIFIIISFLFGGFLNNYFRSIGTKEIDDIIFYIPKSRKFIYAKWFFYPSLLFPLYPLGQIINFSLHSTVIFNGPHFSSWIHFFEQRNIVQWVPLNMNFGVQAIQYDLLLITPAIWTIILFVFWLSVLRKK